MEEEAEGGRGGAGGAELLVGGSLSDDLLELGA